MTVFSNPETAETERASLNADGAFLCFNSFSGNVRQKAASRFIEWKKKKKLSLSAVTCMTECYFCSIRKNNDITELSESDAPTNRTISIH